MVLNNSYIFILAQHRTGSTLLKNSIDAHTSVIMAHDEMNLFEPFRNNTFDKLFTNKIKLQNQLLDKSVYGTFWASLNESGIEIKDLLNIIESATSLSECFKKILNTLNSGKNISYVGVKYPVHISRFNFLVDTFGIHNNAYYIFLVRNPLSMISSKVNDPATKRRVKKFGIFGFLVRLVTIIYMSIEFNLNYGVIKKNRNIIHVIFYEEFIKNKENILKNLCSKLNLDFQKNMLEANGKPSSFDFVHTKSKKIHAFEKYVIKFFTDKNYFKLKHECLSDF